MRKGVSSEHRVVNEVFATGDGCVLQATRLSCPLRRRDAWLWRKRQGGAQTKDLQLCYSSQTMGVVPELVEQNPCHAPQLRSALTLSRNEARVATVGNTRLETDLDAEHILADRPRCECSTSARVRLAALGADPLCGTDWIVCCIPTSQRRNAVGVRVASTSQHPKLRATGTAGSSCPARSGEAACSTVPGGAGARRAARPGGTACSAGGAGAWQATGATERAHADNAGAATATAPSRQTAGIRGDFAPASRGDNRRDPRS